MQWLGTTPSAPTDLVTVAVMNAAVSAAGGGDVRVQAEVPSASLVAGVTEWVPL